MVDKYALELTSLINLKTRAAETSLSDPLKRR